MTVEYTCTACALGHCEMCADLSCWCGAGDHGDDPVTADEREEALL